MNIALMAHDNKKELMVQFCTAYAGILSHHTLCATSVTGKMVSEASGLPIHLFMARIHGAPSRSARASPTTRSIWSSSSATPPTRSITTA